MKLKKIIYLITLLTFNISYNWAMFQGKLDNLGLIHKTNSDEIYCPINIEQYKLEIGKEYTFSVHFSHEDPLIHVNPDITNLFNTTAVSIFAVHDGKKWIDESELPSCVGSCIIL